MICHIALGSPKVLVFPPFFCVDDIWAVGCDGVDGWDGSCSRNGENAVHCSWSKSLQVGERRGVSQRVNSLAGRRSSRCFTACQLPCRSEIVEVFHSESISLQDGDCRDHSVSTSLQVGERRGVSQRISLFAGRRSSKCFTPS